ncbi:hypothetical protein WJX72_004021 [[Myrmecia] bisecta]|uniref:Lysophospholipid acyltransferase n=1 Tax=[Myrmecia] bisecta TaxID=41462 RepID=A0AAW1QES2_9CHLO
MSLFSGNLITPFDWEVDAMAKLGFTLSMLRFSVSFFASIPIGAMLRYIPSVPGRHLFSFLTGFFLVYYPFGNGCLHLVIAAVLTYFAMLIAREHAGTLAWLIDFTYLIGCHIYTASGTAWKEGNMDFTGAMMVLVLKLISTAVTYQDGVRKPELLNAYQQAHVVKRMPSLLEYLSYLFAAGNLLSGPHFELSDYLNYIQRWGPWDTRQAKEGLPSPVVPGLTRFVKALVCLALHMYLKQDYSPDLLESNWYHSRPLLFRMGLIAFVGFVYRLRYYFAWAVAESGLIFQGFCFNGYDDKGRPLWDRYVNTRIRNVEFCTSATHYATHWNTCTGNFLRQYVYERLTPRGKKAPFSVMLVTQLVSGVWHGVFAGYGLFFVSSAFMFESAKIIYRYEQTWPARLRTNPLWMVIKWAYSTFVLNYSASAFMVLSWAPSIAVWHSVGFLGHFLMLAIFLVSMVAPPRRPRRTTAKRSPAEGKATTNGHAATNGDAAKLQNGVDHATNDVAGQAQAGLDKATNGAANGFHNYVPAKQAGLTEVAGEVKKGV